MKNDVDDIKAKLSRRKAKPTDRYDLGLSTGSTLLNLACTGRPDVGFLAGCYYFIVGDSSSGKTFLSLTCLAEAAHNPVFAKYDLVFDDVEHGALMDLEKFFGKKTASRVRPPKGTVKEPECSRTVEDLYANLTTLLDAKKPFVYVLDSEASLDSDAARKKTRKTAKAKQQGEEAKGSFGDGKAKVHSARLREVITRLPDTGSILIFLTQTRDNIGISFDPKTRPGGHALRFYATVEMWSSIARRTTRTVRGKKRRTGIVSKVQVKKNRHTGRERTVELPIHYSHGFDDVGAMADFLVAEGHWQQSGRVEEDRPITAPDLDVVLKREKLIAHVEDNDLEQQVRDAVVEVWQDIEDATSVRRKKRYE
jgi:RecA/RadA recombinase